MRTLIALLVISLTAIGIFCAERQRYTPEISVVRNQILKTLDKSVTACKVYQDGNADCVKQYFRSVYDWYVMGEQNPAAGPPGDPIR